MALGLYWSGATAFSTVLLHSNKIQSQSKVSPVRHQVGQAKPIQVCHERRYPTCQNMFQAAGGGGCALVCCRVKTFHERPDVFKIADDLTDIHCFRCACQR